MTRVKPIVLAIEDDPDFRKALELVLGRLGLNIKGVSRSDEFIEASIRLKPDLYLIDLQLGELSGFELIEKLRKEGVKNPIIIISGSKQAHAITHALELGANDFILKPLDRAFLATKLSRFIQTEELEVNRSKFQEVPPETSPARLFLNGKIIEVDEMGLKILSKSLVPKGTSFKLSSDLILQLGASDRECLLTVSSTWVDPDTKLYAIYAEFEGVDTAFLQGVRRWLSNK